MKNRKHNTQQVSIILESIEQDFPIVDEYEFNIPNIQTSCYCTCQGLNSNFNENECVYNKPENSNANIESLEITFNKTTNHRVCTGEFNLW